MVRSPNNFWRNAVAEFDSQTLVAARFARGPIPSSGMNFIAVCVGSAKLGNLHVAGDSLLVEARRNTLIDCTTPTHNNHEHVELRERAIRALALDACRASLLPHARSDRLNLMWGGDHGIFTEVKPFQDISTPQSPGGRDQTAAFIANSHDLLSLRCTATRIGSSMGGQ